jgi:hypothetical protein
MKNEKSKPTLDRVRITHPHDFFKGRLGHIVEILDQHSLSTYVIAFKGGPQRRAYQRDDFRFLKTLYRWKKVETQNS